MRKLIYAINLTLDGCVDHTKVRGGEDILEYYANVLREYDLLVYGRITYQLMVPYWPDVAKNPADAVKAAIDFAKAFDAVKKVVFSKTIENVGERTRIVRTDLKDEILRLKQEKGGNIMVGGVALPSRLAELDLIDEYHLVFQPYLVGGGRRLLEGINLPEALRLELVDSKTFGSGLISIRYAKP